MTIITSPLNGKCCEEQNVSVVSCIQSGSQGFLLAQDVQHIIFNKRALIYAPVPTDRLFFTPVEPRMAGDRDMGNVLWR